MRLDPLLHLREVVIGQAAELDPPGGRERERPTREPPVGQGQREGPLHELAGRLQVLDPAVTVTTTLRKSGFFRKSDHVELSKTVEAVWKMMGPYRLEPIRNVRIIWPEGPAVEPVQFVADRDDQSLSVPKELMQAWNLPEGIFVSVRPAP